MGTPFFVLSGGLAAWGKGLPSASRLRAGHVPPAPPACGPTPCPPWAAAVPPPARPAPSGLSGKCGGWSPPVGGSGQASRQPLRGATQSGRKAKPLRGRFAGLAPGQPRAGCGAGAPGRPGPHDVGAVGPSAPPARSAALRPALPAWPRLRRRPGRAALPSHSPPGVAAPPPRGVPPPSRGRRPRFARFVDTQPSRSARPVRGRNLDRRAHWRRKRRLPRASRAAGRRGTPPAGGNAGRCPGRQGQGKPRAGRQMPPTSGGLACRCPGQRGKPWRVSRPVPVPRPLFTLCPFGGAFCGSVCCCRACLCFSVWVVALALGCPCLCFWVRPSGWCRCPCFRLFLLSVWPCPVCFCGSSSRGFFCRWRLFCSPRLLFVRCPCPCPCAGCPGVCALWGLCFRPSGRWLWRVLPLLWVAFPAPVAGRLSQPFFWG